MSSPASIGKHPIHPMLVVFPLGLLNFSLFADLLYASGKGGEVWKEVGERTLLGGIVGALAAAIPGFIDYLSLEGTAKKIGTAHMAMNLGLVGLSAFNLFKRLKSPQEPPPVALSAAGAAGLLVSGWLGGHLVYVHGAGVTRKEEEKEKKERPREIEVA